MADRSLMDDVRAAAEEVNKADDTTTTVGRPNVDGGDGRVEGDGSPAVGPDDAGTSAEGRQDDRPRDAEGRFVKSEDGKPVKPRETLRAKPQVISPPAGEGQAKGGVAPLATPPGPIVPDGPKPAIAQPKSDQLIPPPAEWKGDAKLRWDKLPREVQTEIRAHHEALAEQRAAYEPMERAIAPYRQVFIQHAGSEASAVAQLGEFYQAYLTNPMGLIHHIARTRGIDLGQSQGQPQPQGGAPPQTPDVASLIRQAAQQAAQEAVQPLYQERQHAEQQQLQTVVEQFRADSRHPYFEDVRVDMGHFLRTGQAKSMDEAYDKACKAHPVIGPQLLEAEVTRRLEAQTAAAQQARKAAAASISGSPIPGVANGAGNPNADLRDVVRAAYQEHTEPR